MLRITAIISFETVPIVLQVHPPKQEVFHVLLALLELSTILQADRVTIVQPIRILLLAQRLVPHVVQVHSLK
jgi:hypothetical protein